MRLDDQSPVDSIDGPRELLEAATNGVGIAITPPPSNQASASKIMKSAQAKFASRREHSLASPPATLKTGPPITSAGLYGEVPTLQAVQEMDEEELRTLVSELLPALGEARLTAAHSKLQHSLLTIENEEATKRSEVEHEATKREVQVLQENSPLPHHGFSPLKSPSGIVQRNLQLALSHCRELLHENSILEKRLRNSKKVIAQLDGKNVELKDHVQLLRLRIKENRDHLNDMQASGAMSIQATPFHEYGTPMLKGASRTPARPAHDMTNPSTQNPLDALLFAGQVLNEEASSVPSSPNQSRSMKVHAQHLRGAHSLSSLPTTPRPRPVTVGNVFSTPVERVGAHNRVSFSAPGTQLTYDNEARARDDRDSTISVSDHEDDYQNEDLPASQASQTAANMLRRSLESSTSTRSQHRPAPNSSKVVQGKMHGPIIKPAMAQSLKRGSDSNSYDEIVRSSKKAKLTQSESDRIGLGIGDWPSPSR